MVLSGEQWMNEWMNACRWRRRRGGHSPARVKGRLVWLKPFLSAALCSSPCQGSGGWWHRMRAVGQGVKGAEWRDEEEEAIQFNPIQSGGLVWRVFEFNPWPRRFVSISFFYISPALLYIAESRRRCPGLLVWGCQSDMSSCFITAIVKRAAELLDRLQAPQLHISDEPEGVNEPLTSWPIFQTTGCLFLTTHELFSKTFCRFSLLSGCSFNVAQPHTVWPHFASILFP